MKNATKIADSLKSLHKQLVKEHKHAPPKVAMEPVPALVRAAFTYDVPEERVAAAMKVIEVQFVDLNELRVATDLEIGELIGNRYPSIEERVGKLTTILNYIFEKEHTLNLERIKALSKKDARHFLRSLPEIPPFVEAYVMLYAFDASAMPVDESILKYLRDEADLGFEPSLTIEELQKFVEAHLKEQELYDFYWVARLASLEPSKSKKKK